MNVCINQTSEKSERKHERKKTNGTVLIVWDLNLELLIKVMLGWIFPNINNFTWWPQSQCCPSIPPDKGDATMLQDGLWENVAHITGPLLNGVYSTYQFVYRQYSPCVSIQKHC